MKTLLLAVAACLSGAWGMGLGPKMPAGKCRHPIPNMPGLDISQVQDIDFYYISAPNVLIYKVADTVKMKIEKVDGQNGVFLETIKALSIFRTPLNMQFYVKSLGDGVLQKIVKDGEMSYYASIVDIKGNVALVYVCSDEADDIDEDFRYVVATKDVDPLSIEDPAVLFKEVNDKYQFKGELRELPKKWMKKIDL